MSRLTSNSMRTCERSSSLSDSILRMPSMPATESSMTCVIFVSMIGRGCAAVSRRHRDDRPIDVGIFAGRQAIEGHQAEDDQQQADDDSEDRTTHRHFGDTHDATSSRFGIWSEALWRSAWALPDRGPSLPSCKFCVPSTTTRSRSCSPATISTSPGRRRPSVTSRRCAIRRSRRRTHKSCPVRERSPLRAPSASA